MSVVLICPSFQSILNFMIVVGDPANKSLSKKISEKLHCELIYPEIKIFPDGEMRVRIDSQKIHGQKVILIKSGGLPDSSILQLSFTADAIVQAGADKLICIFPYIPYSRADHVTRTGESAQFEVILRILDSAHFSEIITVDPHSIKIQEISKSKLNILSALELFSDKIKEIEPDPDKITLVSPDSGGQRRIIELKNLLGGKINTIFIDKKRDFENGIVGISKIHGKVQGTCFVIDDIISSGSTMLKAVDELSKNSESKLYLFATHAVFSGSASKVLQNSPVLQVFVTDSLATENSNFPKLEILSITDVIVKSIMK